MIHKIQTQTGTLAVTNSEHSNVRVVLEPWADERTLAPASTIVISFIGPAGGQLEVERKPNEIVVYGWEGATMSFVDNEVG
jgi:hypothetical protein